MSAGLLPAEIGELRVIAVARRMAPSIAPDLAAALDRGGIGVLEITVEGEGGVEAIAAVKSSGLVVGAGTVTDIGQAAAAVEAGARFLVTPHLDPDLVQWGIDRGIAVIPGAFTSTEVRDAWVVAGAEAVKIFPASVGGPDLIHALKGPYPDIPLIPTGGVDAANVASYLSAGAFAVGVGGWLTGHDDLDLVGERAASLVEAASRVG